MPRGEKYPAIMNMIEKYEYKYKKPMNFQMLIDYIQEAIGISRKTAREYADDLVKMNYITVDQNSIVTRSFNG
ncbi:hypothetical protein LCGC14_2356610 [marine sediment metagenome]|uniref:Uncharacterized protein n=1 Tax=marine sediment metagenome TaxID=412755 RepID=A0A0F9C7J4_9ZZZZ